MLEGLRHIDDIHVTVTRYLSRFPRRGARCLLLHLSPSATALGSMSDNFSDNQSPEEDNQYSRNYDDNPGM